MRARYKPAALRGAVLFFVLASLAAISNMYEYSLASFLAVFSLTLDTSKKVRCDLHSAMAAVHGQCTPLESLQPKYGIQMESLQPKYGPQMLPCAAGTLAR